MRGKCHPSFIIRREGSEERGSEDGGGSITLLIRRNKDKQRESKRAVRAVFCLIHCSDLLGDLCSVDEIVMEIGLMKAS